MVKSIVVIYSSIQAAVTHSGAQPVYPAFYQNLPLLFKHTTDWSHTAAVCDCSAQLDRVLHPSAWTENFNQTLLSSSLANPFYFLSSQPTALCHLVGTRPLSHSGAGLTLLCHFCKPQWPRLNFSHTAGAFSFFSFFLARKPAVMRLLSRPNQWNHQSVIITAETLGERRTCRLVASAMKGRDTLQLFWQLGGRKSFRKHFRFSLNICKIHFLTRCPRFRFTGTPLTVDHCGFFLLTDVGPATKNRRGGGGLGPKQPRRWNEKQSDAEDRHSCRTNWSFTHAHLK